ncbi:MAG: SEC-C metal-binding domain-containing protein [Arenicella sp.]
MTRGGVPWQLEIRNFIIPFELTFERTSKRRRGFPSETQVKRGVRIVGNDKYLTEKLGRNDPCPCGSGHRF